MVLRHKLRGQSVGVVFGTFAPMHIGHVDLIHRAKRENDAGVVVVVSGENTAEDRGTKVGLHLDRRLRYVREVFRDDELVAVVKLDEEGIPPYPEGWKPWLQKLENAVSEVIEDVNYWQIYVGEETYQRELEKRCDDKVIKTHLIERSIIPISATQIRQNPYDYWKYITKPFRRHFTKKVLIVGSASGGKTTLVRDLARVYNAPYSLEYARSYQDINNVRDDELDTYDYVRLLDGQYNQTASVIDSGSHTGLIFADTNSSVTKAYYDYYFEDSSPKDKRMIESLYQSIVAREQWDLVVLVEPNTTYVDDGFRDMTMSDQAIRDDFTNHLLSLLAPFKDILITVNGDFFENYDCIKQTIAERLAIEL